MSGAGNVPMWVFSLSFEVAFCIVDGSNTVDGVLYLVFLCGAPLIV